LEEQEMNATTTRTANANERNSFHRVVNRICQKFSLTAKEKKQVVEFVRKQMPAEIQLEFTKAIPSDTEQIEIQHGDTVIILAHSASKNPHVCYLMARKNVKKEEKEEFVEVLNVLSNEEQYKIVTGTIKRVKDYLDAYMKVSIDDLVETKLYNFLIVQSLNGKIAVLFTPESPNSEVFSTTRIRVGDYNLNLSFGVNPIKNNFYHVLWVNLNLSEEAKLRHYMEMREAKFCKLWGDNKLPE
jgi:hypothetical protein